MIVYLANKTQFRADILKERGQLARRSLRRRLGLAHSYKVNSSAPSALLGDLLARHSPQDGGGCAFDPARRLSPFRGTSRSLLIKRRPTPFNPSGTARIAPVQTAYKPSAVLSMSFPSIAVQNSFISHNRRVPNGSWCLFREPSDGSRNGKVVNVQSRDIQDPDTGQDTVKIYRSEKTETEDSWSHRCIRLEPDSNDNAFQPLILEAYASTELQVIGEFVGIASWTPF